MKNRKIIVIFTLLILVVFTLGCTHKNSNNNFSINTTPNKTVNSTPINKTNTSIPTPQPNNSIPINQTNTSIPINQTNTSIPNNTPQKWPAVGAIRWDAWYTGTVMGLTDEVALTPVQWHDRLPFYAVIPPNGTVRIRLDTQEQMDIEIAAAKAGGIDYWAFGYYGDNNPNANALKKYLASSHKNDVKYTLIIFPLSIAKTAQIVNHFKNSQYLKVVNGRPLVYVFESGGQFTKDNITALRNAATSAGLPNPYIVWMTWNVNDGMVGKLGLDAISAYALAPNGPDDTVQPYSNLAEVNQKFWNSAKSKGLKVIPLVSTGWDPRPRYENPPPWGIGGHTAVSVGTPEEIAANLKTAKDWVKANLGAAESQVIIMYAWNEFAEGGWLTPMLEGGSARLDAIGRAIADFK